MVNGPESLSVEALEKATCDAGDNGFYIVYRSSEGRTMRRFHTTYPGEDFRSRLLVEMSEEEVRLEEKSAYADEGLTNIKTKLVQLRPEVSRYA